MHIGRYHQPLTAWARPFWLRTVEGAVRLAIPFDLEPARERM
jgi:hypothetical protein